MSSLSEWMLFLAAATLATATPQRDSDQADRTRELKTELREAGVRVTSNYAALNSESKLRTAVSRSTRLRRPLIKTEKELKTAQAHVAQIEAAALKLTQVNVELNAQLSRVAPGDVATNNRLVGLINANNGRIQLLQAQLNQLNDAADTARAKANQAREDYIGHILTLRPQAEDVTREYGEKQADPQIRRLLEELGKLTGKPVKLAPTKAFQNAVAEIEKLESSVLTGAIPLRKVDKALFVSVVINGKAREMIVDSGSSLISLPWSVAQEMGIRVKPDDQSIRARLADGREIRATKVVLKSVRVGQFIAENVEAAVLEPDARHSTPLLGMSFLEKFHFEVRAAESVLALSHVTNKKKTDGKSP